MKILIIYFSATGNTAKIAEVVDKKLKEIGAEVSVLDVTPYKHRPKTVDITPYDAVMFGAPIHSCRAPRVFREWLMGIDGQGKKCSMFFTYGGFGVHPTHYSTRKILEKQNFAVVSSSEFLAAHTFNLGGWRAMMNRPDKSDFEIAEEYAFKTYKKFTGEDNTVLPEFEKTEQTDEFLDSIENFRFKVVTKLPDRNGKTCSMCSICEELCPTGAMNHITGKVNKENCITCLSCVANCPDNVLTINDMSQSWPLKLGKHNTTEEEMKKKVSKVYV